ncbi:MAG: flagellar assembly protein FliW [Deltaproteobacteria bacterium]|nr:flagellar assembly protein FliW [Deltaproteobacteria bacterium]
MEGREKITVEAGWLAGAGGIEMEVIKVRKDNGTIGQPAVPEMSRCEVNIPSTTANQPSTTAGRVIRLSSRYLGEIEAAESKVIAFPSGVLGFPDAGRFIVLDYECDVPFKVLQSVDAPEPVFTIVDPLVVKPDYRISIKEGAVSDLGPPQERNLIVLVILTIPDDNPAGITANLMAPLIINTVAMKGRQIILQDDGLPVRYPIFGPSAG